MQHFRKKLRLAVRDYSWPGWYYVTVCTRGKKDFLGETKRNGVVLNAFGKIAQEQWRWLEKQYNYVIIDKFVVMPDHLHGIIALSDRPVPPAVAGHDRPLQKIKSLSELVGAFKTTSSKLIHQAGLSDFCWQRSFHDRIIRSEGEYREIWQYINNNPSKST